MTAPSGLHQSIQTKLLRFAKERRFDPDLILTRFAAERFLYRISISPYAGEKAPLTRRVNSLSFRGPHAYAWG